jgi:hypothetical protein
VVISPVAHKFVINEDHEVVKAKIPKEANAERSPIHLLKSL